jgi:hypothetical protein
VTIGQSEVILHKGNEKEIIKNGKVIGVTLKGEDYKYGDWKNLYKLNEYIRHNLWEVDYIREDSLHLSGYDYSTSYTNKVIIRKDLKESFKDKDYIIDSIIPSASGKAANDTLYCRIIETKLISVINKAVNYNDIESLNFAHKNLDDFKDEIGNYDFSINVGHSGGRIPLPRSDCNIHVKCGKGAIIVALVVLSVVGTVEITDLYKTANK